MRPKDIRISLVIPAYNEERHLAACLNTVAAQTVRPYEVIVVDNNSTDNTAKIARNYPFVTLLDEPRRGIVYARNTGFNAATGNIIGRTDADVTLPPDWVAYVTEFYRDAANATVGLSGNGRPNNLRFSRILGWVQGQVAFRVNRFLLGHYIFFGSNMAIPTKVWQEVRKNTCARTDIHEDLDLAIHTHRAGHAIAYRETFQVSGRAGRVIENHDQLYANLMLWPQTLRVHGLWTWIFGWIGAVLLYGLSVVPIGFEYVARLFGKKPLID